MKLIPAIDLREGQVVRLAKGDFDRQTDYALDPIELALSYQEQGGRMPARWWIWMAPKPANRKATPPIWP